MAKRGIFLGSISPFLRDRAKSGGWGLCIGAGTSIPAFPRWSTLIERLVALDVGARNASGLSNSLMGTFTPDALIQAAQDRTGASNQKYASQISGELYRDARASLNTRDWQLFTRMIPAHSGRFRRSRWEAYRKLVEKQFPGMAATRLAKIIAKLIDTEFQPDAILSFNAEPLFASLINAYWRISLPPRSRAKKVLDPVTHSITDRKSFRIPYYFCHGALPLPAGIPGGRGVQSIDKLVFSESSYLQLANTSFAWQSSVFLDVCSSRSVVFVGVSLSDSNMRRWLSWVHSNRTEELEKVRGVKAPSTRHYWINVHPGSAREREWIESLVAHLGIRLVWIRSWSQVGDAMQAMLGI